MNLAPVISVCIPAYRRTGFLKRLLDSLAIQTYTDFEIVLTDDSPDDEVGILIRSHALRDRIRYFKNPVTLGTPENWNEGLRKAKGEWIKIMHDDDWFTGPDSLAQFANVIDSTPASFYFSAYWNVPADGKKVSPFAAGDFAARLKKTPEILLASNRIGPPSVVLFRSKPGFFFDSRMRWLVDLDFYIRYLQAFSPAVYLPQRIVNIGISESQVTQTSFGNPVIEITERMLLADKIGYDSAQNWTVYDSWWRFLRNSNIRSETMLREYGYSGPLPPFLSSMISWQSFLPGFVLRTGPLSKMISATHFILSRPKKIRNSVA